MTSALPAMRPDDAYTARIRANVPAELRELPAWVCWKWALAPRRRGEDPTGPRKLTKVPYSPRTGAKAAVNRADTWAPFAEAIAAYERGGYAGLGLVFVPDAGLVGVDLDKCRDAATGELAPWALALVERLASYAEYSPSGTGVHIILCASLPGKEHSRKGAIEVYAGARFFTVTGDRLASAPAGVEERGRVLAEWYGELFAPEDAGARTHKRTPRARRDVRPDPLTVLSDADIIARAMRAKNAPKFSALWRGDTSGYGSTSEADLALLGVLRFYTQDAATLDRLYRQSGLMRDKWDDRHYSTGETYGEHSIGAALAGVYEIWTPRADRTAPAPVPALAPAPAPVAAMPAPAEYPREPDAPAPDASSSSTSGRLRGRRAERSEGEGETGEGLEQLAGALYLRSTRYGALWYAPDAEPHGLYVIPHRAAPYCILSARIDVIRIASHESAGASSSSSASGRGSVYHLVFTPDRAPDRPVTAAVTRDSAMTGALYTDSGLENLCSHTPADKTDLALVWQALTALTAHMGAQAPALRTTMARALGWHDGSGAWVRVNGHIDREGAHVGAGIFAASVPADWPQVLPDAPETLPAVLDARLVRELLTFWPGDVSRYPLAAWGACAYIMRRYTDGRASWELEVFGPTGSGKTALTNWILRAFYGAGYSYGTGTQLSAGRAGDTGIGRVLMRSRLRHHAYMTYDHNARPGQGDYDRQQQDRIDSADATGNQVLGGAKGTRDGGLEMRPQPQGLLIRTGEADPHEYSVTNQKASSDARCVTFVLDVGIGALANESAKRSRAIASRAAELDALAIAYTRWLASLAPGESIAQWQEMRTRAARLVGAIDCTGAYPMRHERAIEQCEDMAAGLYSYAAFLRTVDYDAGADGWRMVRGGCALADELDEWAAALVHDRLAASHELMQRHAEAAGGASVREALAAAFLAWLRGKLFDGAYYLSGQRSEAPRTAPVSWDALGYERNRIQPGVYDPHARARRLGALSDDGRYVLLDNQTLDTIARQAAHDVKAITYTTPARFKADLLAAGALEGYSADPEHRYVRNVLIRERDPETGEEREAQRWRVHILATRLWPQSVLQDASAPEYTEYTEYTEYSPVGNRRETAPQAERSADAIDAGGLLQGPIPYSGDSARTEYGQVAGDTRDAPAGTPDAWEAPPADVSECGAGALICPLCGGADMRDYGAGPHCNVCDVPAVCMTPPRADPASSSTSDTTDTSGAGASKRPAPDAMEDGAI